MNMLLSKSKAFFQQFVSNKKINSIIIFLTKTPYTLKKCNTLNNEIKNDVCFLLTYKSAFQKEIEELNHIQKSLCVLTINMHDKNETLNNEKIIEYDNIYTSQQKIMSQARNKKMKYLTCLAIYDSLRFLKFSGKIIVFVVVCCGIVKMISYDPDRIRSRDYDSQNQGIIMTTLAYGSLLLLAPAIIISSNRK